MTLSSIEIRNFWCLMPVLQVGACGGETELDISNIGIIQLADCFILLSFPKEMFFTVHLCSDNYI